MKNFVQNGDVLEFTAPSGGVTAGKGYLIGATFVVAMNTVAQTLPFLGQVVGVVALDKQGGAGVTFAEGAAVSYDTTNRRCVAPGSGQVPIGTAVKAAVNADTLTYVRLNAVTTAAA